MIKQTVYYALHNGKLVVISAHSMKDFVPSVISGQEMTLESERYTQVVDDMYYKHEDTQTVDDPYFVSTNSSDEISMMRLHKDNSLKSNDRLCFPKEPHINPSVNLPQGAKWIREQNLDRIIQIEGDSRYFPDTSNRGCMIKATAVLGQDILESSGRIFDPTSKTVSEITGGYASEGVYRGFIRSSVGELEVVKISGLMYIAASLDPDDVGIYPIVPSDAEFIPLSGNAYVTATARTIAAELDSNGNIINYYFLDEGTNQKVIGLDLAHSLAKIRLSNNQTEVIVGLDIGFVWGGAITRGAPYQIVFDPEYPQYVQLNEEVDGCPAGTVLTLLTIEDDGTAYLRDENGEQVDIPTSYLTFLNEYSSGITNFDSLPLPTLEVTQECNLQTSHTASTKKICRMAVSSQKYNVVGYAYRNGVMLFKIHFLQVPPDYVSGSVEPEFENNFPDFGWVSGRGVDVDEAVWDDVPVTELDGHNVRKYVGRYVTVTQDLGLMDEVFDPPRRAYATQSLTLDGVSGGSSQEVQTWDLVRITGRRNGQLVGTVDSNDFEFTVEDEVFSSGKLRYEHVPTLEPIAGVNEVVWINPSSGFYCGCTTSAVSEHNKVFKAMLENDNDGETEDGVPDNTKSIYPNQLLYVIGTFTYGSYRYYALRLDPSNEDVHYIQAFKLSLAKKTGTAPYTAYAMVSSISSFNDPYGQDPSSGNAGEVGREISCLEVYSFSEPLGQTSPIRTPFGFVEERHLSLTGGLELPKTEFEVWGDRGVLVSQNPYSRLYVLGMVTGTLEAPILHCSESITDFSDEVGLLETRKYCDLENCTVYIPDLDTPYTLSNVRVFTVYSPVRDTELDIVTTTRTEGSTGSNPEDTLFDALVMVQTGRYTSQSDGSAWVIYSDHILHKSPFSGSTVSGDYVQGPYHVTTSQWYKEDDLGEDYPYYYFEERKGWCDEHKVMSATPLLCSWLDEEDKLGLEDIQPTTATFKSGVTSSEPKALYCSDIREFLSMSGVGEVLDETNLSDHLFTKRIVLPKEGDLSGDYEEYFVDQNGVAYSGLSVNVAGSGYVPYNVAKYLWLTREDLSVYETSLPPSSHSFDGMSVGTLTVYSRTDQGYEVLDTMEVPSAVFLILGEETVSGTTFYKVTKMWSALKDLPITVPFYIKKEDSFHYVGMDDDAYYRVRRDTRYIIMSPGIQSVYLHYVRDTLSVNDTNHSGSYSVSSTMETLFVADPKVPGTPPFYINHYGYYLWESIDGVSISDRLIAQEDSSVLVPMVQDVSQYAVYIKNPMEVDLEAYFENEPAGYHPKGLAPSYNMSPPTGSSWNTTKWAYGLLQGTHKASMKITKTFPDISRTVRWYRINDAGVVYSDGSIMPMPAWVYCITSDKGIDGIMAPLEEYTSEFEWGVLDTPKEVVFLKASNITDTIDMPDLPAGISQPVLVSRTVRPSTSYDGTFSSTTTDSYVTSYMGHMIIIQPPEILGNYGLTFMQEECDITVSPDRVHTTPFGCSFETSDPYESDLVSNVIRTRGYHCKRRLYTSEGTSLYQVQVFVRESGSSEAVPVMAWCNGYEFREVPLVQEFQLSGTISDLYYIYMYNDENTRVCNYDDNQSPHVTCLGRTENGFVKVRYTSMGEERIGYVLESNVVISDPLSNPSEGNYTLRVLSYDPQSDNPNVSGDDVIGFLWSEMDEFSDDERQALLEQGVPTNVFPHYTDVSLDEALEGLGRLTTKQQLHLHNAGAELVIVDHTGTPIDLSAVDNPYSYTLQVVSFSVILNCLYLIRDACGLGLSDCQASVNSSNLPSGVVSYINTKLDIATQAFEAIEALKSSGDSTYDAEAEFRVVDKNGDVVLPEPLPLYSVRLVSYEQKVNAIKLVRKLSGDVLGLGDAKDFVEGTLPAIIPYLDRIPYEQALEAYNMSVDLQTNTPDTYACGAVIDIVDSSGATVYPT